MDHKTFSAYTLKTDAQQGIVEAIVAVMGNIDQGDDIIHNGSFTKTITERRGKIRVLDQHQTDSIMRAIGKPLEIREISRDQLPPDLLRRYPTATGGLYTKTQYLMDTPEGRGAFERIKAGAVDEYSIGYDPLDVDYSKVRLSDGTEKTVRNLRTNKLFEYSPVLWAMNDATQTLSAKGATGATDLPLSDRSKPWDGSGAEGRVRSWAGATDGPNAKYRSAFFWYDAAAPENFTSYKLQFADVVDGKLTAIPRGIFAVAAVLQGSRGGVNIPAGDKETVKGKVSAYYRRMAKEFDDDSIVAPWDNKATKSIDLTSYVEDVTDEFNDEYGPGEMGIGAMSECYCVWRVYDDHLVVYEMMSDDYYSVPYSVVNGEYQFATQDTWIEGSLEFVADTTSEGAMKQRGNKAPLNKPRQYKTGRVFAARNLDKLKQLKDLVESLLADAATVPEEDMPMDNAPTPEGKRAAQPNAPVPTGPITSPIDETLMQSIEIELAELKLLEV